MVVEISCLDLFAVEACFDRFQMFLCFCSPSLIVYRVGVRFVRFVRYRRVGGLRRFLFKRGVASCVRRDPAVERAKDVHGTSDEGPGLSFMFPIAVVGNYQRRLRRELSAVGGSNNDFVKECVCPVKEGLRYVNLVKRKVVCEWTGVNLSHFQGALRHCEDIFRHVLRVVGGFRHNFPKESDRYFFPLRSVRSLR